VPTLSQTTVLSRRDIQFLVFDWLRIDELTDRPRYRDQSRGEYLEVLALAERLATELFASHNRLSDSAEPNIVDGAVALVPEIGEALQAFCDAGLLGIAVDASLGGMQLPLTLATAVFAWFHAANTATTAYAMLTTAAASLLAANGSAEQADRWVPPMVEGRFFGTMCLSEPHAGSSLADITTRAVPQDDGTYRLFGTKMWISGGEHELADNIVHMVLAKLPDAEPGVKGISLFVVPRRLVEPDGSLGEPNDVVLAGLNHKMGSRGTVNTVLGFGEGAHRPGQRPGAVGEIVGDPGTGLASMFRMMNEARIGVGIAGAALGATGYLKSLRYARERPQGRAVDDRDPAGNPVPIVRHADVRRMLLDQKAYAEGALALVLYCGRLYDDVESLSAGPERDRAALLLELLTPVAKSWPAQWCLEANSLAIQVHGGYGYSCEYDVEQHYRDNRLNAIHEGTHGIQALDLLGRKVRMQDGAAFEALSYAILQTVAVAEEQGGEASALAGALRSALSDLARTTAEATARRTPSTRLADASTYLEAFGHIVVAWLWLEQHLATSGAQDDFSEGKRLAARWFFARELPKTRLQLELVRAADETTLSLEEGWL
jgi:butyryl-CoA dehydrogenase